MATADDYLSIAEARLDLRLTPASLDDAAISRYRAQAFGIVARLTGRTIPDPSDSQVDDGLRAAITMALLSVFEGRSSGVPRALYQLIEPYRRLISTPPTAPTAPAFEQDSELTIRLVLEDLTVAIPENASSEFIREFTFPPDSFNGDGSVAGRIVLYVSRAAASQSLFVIYNDGLPINPPWRIKIVTGRAELIAVVLTETRPTVTQGPDSTVEIVQGNSTVLVTFDDPP